MKKNFVYLIGIFVGIFAFLTVACKTTDAAKTENLKKPETEKTTFMNTGYALDGKIYSSAIFDKITLLTIIKLDTKEEIEIAPKMYKYDKKTTEVTISKDFVFPEIAKENICFHIVGVPSNPPKFVLNNIEGEPLVMIGDTIAVKDTDYKFYEKTVEFMVPIDLDNDSYVIFSDNTDESTNTVGNKYEDFEEFYTAEITKYLAEKNRFMVEK